MYRRGRPVVEVFGAREQLYRRYRRQEIVNGELVAAALAFPKQSKAHAYANADEGSKKDSGQSVNRSAFSKVKDALWDDKGRYYEGWGVFQFPVSCLPEQSVCPTEGEAFTFFPKHVPLENNYAHTEIWCDHLPRRNAGLVRPTKLVRKELRAAISQNINIEIEARV